MLTEQRAHYLAKAAENLDSFLGTFSANDLIDWVGHELGHPESLDDFQQVGDILTKAKAPTHLLHIVSGNTPHASLQSLLRGLLIRAQNTLKLPQLNDSSTHELFSIPEVQQFYQALPSELQQLCCFTTELSDDLIATADCVIAIGSNQTIASIHSRLQPHQRFIPHGHKISFALIDKPSAKHAQLAATDVSIFNQQGCLSPHAIYVKERAEEFAPMLAKAMESYSQRDSRFPISISESGAIRNLRETIRYQVALEPHDYQLHESSNGTSWTVIFENSPKLQATPLNRTIYVRPWPDTLDALGDETKHLSTIALSPMPALLKDVEELNPPRICQLGKTQQPHLFWHHDGFAPLASLVTWQDIHL